MKDFKIAAIRVRPLANQIQLGEQSITLEPLAMKTLIFLARNQGQVIKRETLLAELWQGRVVSDNALNRIIGQLRKSLGDNITNPIYIKTVSKTGYILIAEVVGLKNSKVQPTFLKLVSLYFLVLITIVGTSYWYSKSDPSSWLLVSNQQLTSLPGYEEHLVFTPDEKSILFTHQSSGISYNDIYIKSLESGEFRQLTDNTLRYDELVFSNNEKQVAYIQHNNLDCSLQVGQIESPEYALTNTKQIMPCHYGSILFPSWSFDDKYIYYSHFDDLRFKRSISKVNIQTKEITPVFDKLGEFTDDSQLTANGKYIAYLRTIGNKQEVRLYNTQSLEDSIILAFDEQKLFELDWYTHENLLIRKVDGLYRLTLAGKLESINTNNSNLNNTGQIFSSSEGVIAYSQLEYLTQLSEVNNPLVNGKNLTRSVSPSSRVEYLGYYSPDGNSLLFKSNRESQEFRLWLITNNETKLVPITDYNGRWFFDWSTDGTEIIYLNRDHRLTAYNLLTNESVFLTDTNYEIDRGRISLDKQYLYFVEFIDKQGQLFQQKIDGTERKQLTTEGTNYFHESNDGKYIYYSRAYENGLWRLNKTSFKHEMVWPDFNQFNYHSWQLFNQGVYYKRSIDGTNGIYFYDFNTKKQTTLIVREHLYSFHVSPNEQTILLTEVKEITGDLYTSKIVKSN